VICQGERYLMTVRSDQEAHAPGTLSFPGGKVEGAGEQPDVLERTLRREALEEAGVELGSEFAYPESKSFIADDGDPNVDIVFLCRYAGGWSYAADPADVVAQADALTIHARLIPETHHLLGAAEFNRMKPGAFLVNTARGAIIDEPALVDALRAGRLSGAALDVMETELLPADSPLAALENVLLTPHLASFSREASAQLYQMSAEIAAALLQNRWVTTVVNLQARVLAESRFGVFQG
jgi:8-oxo-dGTP pyrophosphatase MutT (NUDIX family)